MRLKLEYWHCYFFVVAFLQLFLLWCCFVLLCFVFVAATGQSLFKNINGIPTEKSRKQCRWFLVQCCGITHTKQTEIRPPIFFSCQDVVQAWKSFLNRGVVGVVGVVATLAMHSSRSGQCALMIGVKKLWNMKCQMPEARSQKRESFGDVIIKWDYFFKLLLCLYISVFEVSSLNMVWVVCMFVLKERRWGNSRVGRCWSTETSAFLQFQSIGRSFSLGSSSSGWRISVVQQGINAVQQYFFAIFDNDPQLLKISGCAG